MTGTDSVAELLKELITEGEPLVPQGGAAFHGYNSRLQPDYVSWRHRAIAGIQELGQKATAILRDLEADGEGPYFFQSSAGRVLGSLSAALAIATRIQGAPASPSTSGEEPPTRSSTRVFLVHGHDHALLQQTARFLDQLGLKPIVLFEQPAGGRTIIEKLEHYSDVQAAVVLLMPDDVGKAAEHTGEAAPRARQNVILELGYFIGCLGRDRVAVLHDESVELPSDYRGVEYIKVDAEAAWKLKLARELKQAGLEIDMNRAV